MSKCEIRRSGQKLILKFRWRPEDSLTRTKWTPDQWSPAQWQMPLYILGAFSMSAQLGIFNVHIQDGFVTLFSHLQASQCSNNALEKFPEDTGTMTWGRVSELLLPPVNLLVKNPKIRWRVGGSNQGLLDSKSEALPSRHRVNSPYFIYQQEKRTLFVLISLLWEKRLSATS